MASSDMKKGRRRHMFPFALLLCTTIAASALCLFPQSRHGFPFSSSTIALFTEAAYCTPSERHCAALWRDRNAPSSNPAPFFHLVLGKLFMQKCEQGAGSLHPLPLQHSSTSSSPPIKHTIHSRLPYQFGNIRTRLAKLGPFPFVLKTSDAHNSLLSVLLLTISLLLLSHAAEAGGGGGGEASSSKSSGSKFNLFPDSKNI
ncbi:uncharacterized protein UDID_19358 [Ustilago sp. UG-2017a]|nr:uncharacterized protein UDID_19358 [Ustilago sp. UG-2017a]